MSVKLIKVSVDLRGASRLAGNIIAFTRAALKGEKTFHGLYESTEGRQSSGRIKVEKLKDPQPQEARKHSHEREDKVGRGMPPRKNTSQVKEEVGSLSR